MSKTSPSKQTKLPPEIRDQLAYYIELADEDPEKRRKLFQQDFDFDREMDRERAELNGLLDWK